MFIQRVGIFVDVQNMFYSAKNLHKSKIDYEMLLNKVTEDRDLVRALAYVVQRPDVPQNNFFDALSRIGYEIRAKEARNRTDDEGNVVPSKGSYELNLAIDAIEMSSKLDTIVLVTGDGQYVPLILHLKSKGCKVEVVSFAGSTSKDLLNVADRFIHIEPEWTIPMKAKSEEEVVRPPIDFDEQQPETNDYRKKK